MARAAALVIGLLAAAASCADASAGDPVFAVASGGAEAVVLDGDTLSIVERRRLDPSEILSAIVPGDRSAAIVVARDGRIARLTLPHLSAGASSHLRQRLTAAALSADDRYLMIAVADPGALVVLDARTLERLKSIPAKDEKRTSEVAGLVVAGARETFIAAMADIPEIWEVSYSDRPPYRGWVHDHRDDGPPEQHLRFPLRRIPFKSVHTAHFVDAACEHLVAAAGPDLRGAVIDLYIGRKVAAVEADGRWAWNLSAQWSGQDGPMLATPSTNRPALAITDMRTWSLARQVGLLAPAALLASHPGAASLWAAGFAGADDDAAQRIDKLSLAAAPPFRPRPGARVAAIAFDRAGRRALIAVTGPGGGVLLWDADGSRELASQPLPGLIAMAVPSR